MNDSQKSLDQQPTKAPRAKERFIEVSGPDEYGRAKTHIALSHSLWFSDGSMKVLQELTISLKPIVSVFSHYGIVNVELDFQYRDDMDLNMAWQLLDNYKNPLNSVSWTEDELESGKYLDGDGNEHLIYFPMVELTIIPKGKETEFALTGLNPIDFYLSPGGPRGEACVLHMPFQEDWFTVKEDLLDAADLDEIRIEANKELGPE